MELNIAMSFLVFALLPDKRQNTYKRLFEALKTLNPSLSPTSIMTDFEVSAINAFKEVFPSAECHGCFFHLCQSFWRHIQALPDVRSKYMDADDLEFPLLLRQLPALAYVPVDDVIHSFDVLMDSDFFRQHEAILQPLLDYFEDNYIGRLTRSGDRRAPRYPIAQWNCFESALNNMPRTNNAVEGWHRGFASLIDAQHPSIWKFIESLKKEQSLNELKIEQYVSGNGSQTMKKKYKDTSERIQHVVQEYGTRNTLEYLRGIAYNFQLQSV